MYLYCQNCQFQTSRQLCSRNFKRNSFENMFQSSHIYFTQCNTHLDKYKKSFKKYFANILMHDTTFRITSKFLPSSNSKNDACFFPKWNISKIRECFDQWSCHCVINSNNYMLIDEKCFRLLIILLIISWCSILHLFHIKKKSSV